MEELQREEDSGMVWRCGESAEAGAAVGTWLRLRWSGELMTTGYQRVKKEAATAVDRSRDGGAARRCQLAAKWGVVGQQRRPKMVALQEQRSCSNWS
ncbi:hypothetical protein AMTR_s00082p00097190 [Amborella trichopoda]|uniref:Uncharacterized protein n=1 Tax=Amborella trichopoda TaxID=13333 RepID=W1NPP5_AMBTC|nr:hypothetical protein AMTR_s00082p00097190 [Amborella trichopoda]